MPGMRSQSWHSSRPPDFPVLRISLLKSLLRFALPENDSNIQQLYSTPSPSNITISTPPRRLPFLLL